MKYFAICGLTSFLVGISCALFIFFNKPRTPLKILWSIYGVVASLWGFGAFYLFTATHAQEALFWGRWINLDAIFITLFFFNVVVLLTNAYEQYKKIVIFYYGVFTAYFLTAFLLPQYYIPSVSPKLGFPFYPDAGPIFYFFPVIFFSALIHAWIILYKAYQKASAIKRNQYKYFLLITLICYPGACTSLFPVFNIPIFPFGVILAPVHDIAVTYIIIKYHLMDIRIIIRKGLIYTILASLITLFYVTAVYLLEKAFHHVIIYHSSMGSTGVLILLALFFIPLKDYIQSFVDRFFFKASYAQIIEENDLLRQQSIRAQRYKMMAALSLNLITELRNPLTTLAGYDYHLPSKLSDMEFMNKFTETYHRELQRLQGLIQQLSDFSELKPLNLQNVDMTMLMSELLELLPKEIQLQDVKLYKYYNEDCKLIINADQEQLKVALMMFLIHSIRSTPSHGQIWVGMEEAMGGVEISIKDTGKGMSQEDLSKIFDPTFTVSADKKDAPGSLAQAQSIIAHHGGKVMVDSQLNVGTEWIIQLPKLGV